MASLCATSGRLDARARSAVRSAAPLGGPLPARRLSGSCSFPLRATAPLGRLWSDAMAPMRSLAATASATDGAASTAPSGKYRCVGCMRLGAARARARLPGPATAFLSASRAGAGPPTRRAAGRHGGKLQPRRMSGKRQPAAHYAAPLGDEIAARDGGAAGAFGARRVKGGGAPGGALQSRRRDATVCQGVGDAARVRAECVIERPRGRRRSASEPDPPNQCPRRGRLTGRQSAQESAMRQAGRGGA